MSASLLAIDERRRAAILRPIQAQARRNAASKEIGNAKKAKDEVRAAKLMPKSPSSRPRCRSSRWRQRRRMKSLPRSCRYTQSAVDEVPDGTDETAMCSVMYSARSANTALRRNCTTISAARWATWISRPRRNYPARALSC